MVKVEPPLPWLQRLNAFRVFYAVCFSVLIADQVTKIAIDKLIAERLGFIEVIPGFFNLIHVRNAGAAWSMLEGHSVLLATVAALTLVAIYYWRVAIGLRDRLAQISFGLLCGGIIGNLIDRVARGKVVDFLDFHFGSYVYPTFNVADSGICVGVAIYFWYTLRQGKE